MFKLLRKIWFLIKGHTNDFTDKNTNPEVVLRQAAREMADQRKNLRGVWVSLDMQVRKHAELIEEKQNQYETNKGKAKEFRDKGDETMALRYAQRCMTLDKWIKMTKSSIETATSRMSTIEDEINKLKFEEDNLNLEASLAKSTVSMSSLDNEVNSASGTSSEYVKTMVESARDRVKNIESEAQSNRSAFDKFDTDETENTASADAKTFLSDL